STIIEEPFLAYLPFRAGEEESLASRKPYLDHAIGFREITHVRITMPGTRTRSAALRAVEEIGCASFTSGDEQLIEVGFDNGQRGQSADFRPELPLIFHW